MRFAHDFQADLAAILTELDSGRPFAFNRFADGELAILEERDIPTADGWSAVNVSDKFRDRLRAALQYRDKDYYVGIGCPCCNKDEWLRLMELAGREPDDPQVTFSNVFVNGNWDSCRRKLENEYTAAIWSGDGRNYVNSPMSDIDYMIDIIKNNTYWYGRELCGHKPLAHMLAFGPATKIMIHELRLQGCQATLIDIGSVLDSSGRSYHDPNHPNRKKICQWSTKTIDNPAPHSI